MPSPDQDPQTGFDFAIVLAFRPLHGQPRGRIVQERKISTHPTEVMTLDPDFPCSLYVHSNLVKHVKFLSRARTIAIPLPTHRLASSALCAIQVDAELSPLVRRSFSLGSIGAAAQNPDAEDACGVILITQYKATTNRMLRVAVNGFMESLGLVLGVVEALDVDVLNA